MWRYVQATGELFTFEGTLQEKGYSGRGAAKNDPSQQCVADQGPIPRGDYTIGSAITHPRLGPVTLPLRPDPINNMCGRSAFFIHGDSASHPGEASDGCIIMRRPTREAVSQSHDNRLHVVADRTAAAPSAVSAITSSAKPRRRKKSLGKKQTARKRRALPAKKKGPTTGK